MFERLYFGVQSLRNGVDRLQIERARNLLDAPSAELRDHVAQRLKEVHKAPRDPFEWLQRQPLTDRSDLRGLMAESIERQSRRRVEVRKTSGSTGTPFRFVKDKRMTAMMDAVMWAVYGWHGIEPGQRHARFWGMPRDRLQRTKRQAMDRLLHRRRLNAFDLVPSTALSFFDRLRRFQPSYIHAYPNLLLEFVKYCTDANRDGTELGVATIVCGGELLAPATREAIGEFFGATVVNEYGCSESGLLSIDCEFGCPHLLPVAAYPELVNSRETSEGGTAGEVVVTDLYGTLLPLLRYRLNDRAILNDVACACGRDLPRLSPVIGRVDSFIETPTGRVYDAILAYSVPKNVLQFRAYQIARDHLFVEAVVSSKEAEDYVLRNLEETWRRELGSDMCVRAVAVDVLPNMESGKLAYFVPLDDVSDAIRARARSE